MQPTLSYLEMLARRAGAILRDGYSKEHKVDYKGVIDLVTEVDHQSEAFLLAGCRWAIRLSPPKKRDTSMAGGHRT